MDITIDGSNSTQKIKPSNPLNISTVQMVGKNKKYYKQTHPRKSNQPNATVTHELKTDPNRYKTTLRYKVKKVSVRYRELTVFSGLGLGSYGDPNSPHGENDLLPPLHDSGTTPLPSPPSQLGSKPQKTKPSQNSSSRTRISLSNGTNYRFIWCSRNRY